MREYSSYYYVKENEFPISSYLDIGYFEPKKTTTIENTKAIALLTVKQNNPSVKKYCLVRTYE
jgi:hypothetical protein